MKVYIVPDDDRDTLIEGILHYPGPEELYVLWRVDGAAEGKCLIYVDFYGVTRLVRAGRLHAKTFEDFILERYSTGPGDPPC